jgi:hypothetical protein
MTIYIDPNSAIRERMTHLSRQAKDLNVQYIDLEQDKAKSNQSKLGNKSVT